MVETDREYILQWTGHAESITERFSGLLARQALVDVTLLCQEQRLRVHKLVLASCSLYFEEILQQDLGQEPVILLKDFDFNILKAMVEFMYCGETTIAHCHLQSLLDAAQVFKVKDLESIVTSMIETSIPEIQEQEDTEITETSCPSSSSVSYESPQPDNAPADPEHLEPETLPVHHSPKQSSPEEADNHQNNLKEQTTEPEYDHPMPIGIGECSRVYTHKRRTTAKIKNPTFKELNKTLSTDCIDLTSENSCDTAPVTLSSLDLDQDYAFNHQEIIHPPYNFNQPNLITSERYRSIYDNLDIQKFAVPNYKNLRKFKELFSVENHCNSIESTPVLRRSVRLNQLESDDSVNNNNNEGINCRKSRDYRRLKKLNKLSKIKSIKKRKISDENRKHVNSKSLKSARKIVKNTRKLRDERGKNSKIKNFNGAQTKFNTIATVDRSLWGDMSDLRENCQIDAVLPDYSQSKEIPFAVGLLPLRAALERMQAMPDYQPRKTRSSVAPFRSDCGIKRKNGEMDCGLSRKPSSPERSINDESSTVCHIKIHTSSQCTESDNIEEQRFISVESTSDKR